MGIYDEDNRIITELREIKMLIKLAFFEEIKAIIAGEFADPRVIEVYKLTNGERSTREIAKEIELKGVNKDFVSQCWKRWAELGFVEETPKQKGRKIALFTLEEFGL